MTKFIRYIVFWGAVVLSAQAYAWNWWPVAFSEPDTCRDSLYYVGSVQAVSSSGASAPSLMWHNTYGTISSLPHSGTFSAGIIKPETRPNRWYDYDFGVVLDGRFGGGQAGSGQKDVTGYFRQLYAHLRLWFVDISAGMVFPCL